jgi:nucleotide-binding universal stress UspA family protein
MFDPIFSRILVAFDNSEPSKRALDLASKTAAILKGELIVLTVVPRVTMPIFSEDGIGSFSVAENQNIYDKMREFYKRALEKAEAEVRIRFPDLKLEALLMEGRPSAIIIEEAELRDVNLIMMGSRGLGGITGWLLGSTSNNVVNQCTKPILLLK